MIYDIYQLSGQIDTLVKKGSAESATQIRSIAEQLKTNLTEIEQNGNGNEDVISVTSLEVEAMDIEQTTLSVLRIFVHSVSCHFSCQNSCNSIFL